MACVADYYHTTHNISFTASALIILCRGNIAIWEGGGETYPNPPPPPHRYNLASLASYVVIRILVPLLERMQICKLCSMVV